MFALEEELGEMQSDEDLIEEEDVDNEKADKIIKRELEQKLDKFKPAEGVQFVEYDIYGFPKTEEMA